MDFFVGSVNYMVMLDKEETDMTVFNLQDNRFLGETHVCKPDENHVNALVISPDEKCIYICNDSIHTYDLHSLKRLSTFKGQK
jgi:hypothetical protein